MLDTTGAHSKIFFRWLGGLAAEPVWTGSRSISSSATITAAAWRRSSVNRPPREDLEGSLRDDLGSLKERLLHARPETPTERALHQCAVRWLEELLENPATRNVDCSFSAIVTLGPLAAGLVLGLSPRGPRAGLGK